MLLVTHLEEHRAATSLKDLRKSTHLYAMPDHGSTFRRRILLVVFFFTMFSSLIYQLVWGRALSHIFGTSALAESTVLAVFMAGLALGALLGGALLARARNPYRFLAGLQLMIGAGCLLALLTITLVHRNHFALLQVAGGGSTTLFNIVLFVVTSAILVVPIFLIGVAFPTVVQLHHHEVQRVGRSVGSCYMMDTLGGALGLSLAAFWLIPRLGFFRVSVLASAINLALGLVVLAAFWKAMPTTVTRDEPVDSLPVEPGVPVDRFRERVVMAVFFSSGFAALMFEVLWIRHVSLLYGGSVHSFAIVVISFLLGLGLGSWLHGRILDRIANQVRLYAAINLTIGLTGILLTTMFPHLEHVFLRVYNTLDNYPLLMASLAGICIALILVPTIGMGATLPVLSGIYASSARVGRDVGRLFAVNSFGALVGTFCAGFLIIPAIGIHYAAFIAGGIYVVIAFTFLWTFETNPSTRRRAGIAFATALAVAAVIYVPIYEPAHLYNGAYYYGTVYKGYEREYFDDQKDAAKHLVYLKHSPYGQAAVYGNDDGNMYVTHNGKLEASFGESGVIPRKLLAHIPLFMHLQPRSCLNIGLGGGMTLAAVVTHDLDTADVAEINPAMVEANRTVLPEYNDNVLANPKVHVIVADARNYLANTDKRYDVIISEPPEIWVAGISSLFTQEFYRTVHRALRPDGMLCQWIDRYDMTQDDYDILLNTITREFPYIYEFDAARLTGHNYYKELILLATKQEVDISNRVGSRRLEAALSGSEDTEDDIDMLKSIETASTRGPEELAPAAARATLRNTDDLPVLEFRILRHRFPKFRPKD